MIKDNSMKNDYEVILTFRNFRESFDWTSIERVYQSMSQ
jgi:hypothetical protein